MRSSLVAALVLALTSCCGGQGMASGPARDCCVIPANGDGSDDVPNVLNAFSKCRTDSTIVFSKNTTYYMNSVLNTTQLKNVEIQIHGKLLWSNDTTYWLNNSMQVGFQNQSTVWFLGGEGLTVDGYGTGTLDGNGQTWYDLVKGVSNYPNRPMGLTIWEAKDSTFRGLNFVQSQMWTMAIMYSKNVLMENIYVNSSTSSKQPARNTDGADILYSDNITMRGWTVDNGDDAISLKANSTNILVEDSIFYRGQGLAFGSIGQYPGEFDTIENATARNITVSGTNYAAYFKTWTGEQVDYPPNGGGAGLGYISNISIQDFTLIGVRSSPIAITQCTTYSGTVGDCNSSLFKLKNLFFSGLTGTTASKYVGSFQCSAASGGCDNIEFENFNLTDAGESVTDFKCSNVNNPVGFVC